MSSIDSLENKVTSPLTSNDNQNSSDLSYLEKDTRSYELTADNEDTNEGLFTRIKNSFKRAEEVETSNQNLQTITSINSNYDEDEQSGQLQRTIKPRHLFMISIGTGVGTGMLVSTGSALRQAGPGNLFIAYLIASTFIYTTYNSIAELAIVYKNLPGSFNDMFKFLVDPAFGFATNICYGITWLCVLPLELVTSALLIRFWTTKTNADIYVACFYVFLVGLNLYGGEGYAEFEFMITAVKFTAVLSFFFFALIKDLGGVKGEPYIGGKYWRDPGAFRGENAANRFKGLCACFVFAIMSYGGFESSVLLSSVVQQPVRALKKGRKMLCYRIAILYLGLIIFISLVVPYNSPKLLGGGNAASDASPLIIATSNIVAYPHILNAVILMSVLSVANNSLYCASRVWLSFFTQYYPHPTLTYVDRRGRPMTCLIIAFAFGLLCFLAAASFRVVFFNWLIAVAGLAFLFTYSGMNLAHIRFRQAMKHQGRSLNELAYVSQTGVWGSYWGLLVMGLLFIAQFWIAIVPIGEGKANANSFFQNYLCVVVWIVCYFGYKLYNRDWKIFIPLEEMDIMTNRTIYDGEAIKEEENERALRIRNSSIFKRILNFWC